MVKSALRSISVNSACVWWAGRGGSRARDMDETRREHCGERCNFLCVFDLKCHKMKQFSMQILPGGMPPDPLAWLAASRCQSRSPPPLKIPRSAPGLVEPVWDANSQLATSKIVQTGDVGGILRQCLADSNSDWTQPLPYAIRPRTRIRTWHALISRAAERRRAIEPVSKTGILRLLRPFTHWSYRVHYKIQANRFP